MEKSDEEGEIKIKNRSRSRSKKRKHRTSHKSRKHYKKNHSRNNSSSSLSERFEEKLERLRNETSKVKKERKNNFSDDPKLVKRIPNKNALANIIQDNIKINRKLDIEEVERASINLKKVDKDIDRKVIIVFLLIIHFRQF
jgi:hypothetical protein